MPLAPGYTPYTGNATAQYGDPWTQADYSPEQWAYIQSLYPTYEAGQAEKRRYLEWLNDPRVARSFGTDEPAQFDWKYWRIASGSSDDPGEIKPRFEDPNHYLNFWGVLNRRAAGIPGYEAEDSGFLGLRDIGGVVKSIGEVAPYVALAATMYAGAAFAGSLTAGAGSAATGGGTLAAGEAGAWEAAIAESAAIEAAAAEPLIAWEAASAEAAAIEAAAGTVPVAPAGLPSLPSSAPVAAPSTGITLPSASTLFKQIAPIALKALAKPSGPSAPPPQAARVPSAIGFSAFDPRYDMELTGDADNTMLYVAGAVGLAILAAVTLNTHRKG